MIANGTAGATLALTAQGGNWVLNAANTYTGATTVTGGTLRIGDGTSGSLGNTPITVNGGALILNGAAASTSLSISTGSLAINTGGSLAAPTVTIKRACSR